MANKQQHMFGYFIHIINSIFGQMRWPNISSIITVFVPPTFIKLNHWPRFTFVARLPCFSSLHENGLFAKTTNIYSNATNRMEHVCILNRNSARHSQPQIFRNWRNERRRIVCCRDAGARAERAGEYNAEQKIKFPWIYILWKWQRTKHMWTKLAESHWINFTSVVRFLHAHPCSMLHARSLLFYLFVLFSCAVCAMPELLLPHTPHALCSPCELNHFLVPRRRQTALGNWNSIPNIWKFYESIVCCFACATCICICCDWCQLEWKNQLNRIDIIHFFGTC